MCLKEVGQCDFFSVGISGACATQKGCHDFTFEGSLRDWSLWCYLYGIHSLSAHNIHFPEAQKSQGSLYSSTQALSYILMEGMEASSKGAAADAAGARVPFPRIGASGLGEAFSVCPSLSFP